MSSRNHRAQIAEKSATVVIWSVAILIVSLLSWMLIDIFWRGFSELSWSFLVEEPANAGRSGGIGPVIVSTLLILVVTVIVAVPLSIASAIALAEQTRRKTMWSRFVRRSLDVLAAVPSIVFGLFGNAFFCVALGMGYSILSGGLTLACMVLPIMIRTAEQGIRSVPDQYLYAAASLGLSKATTLARIVLPAAAPALAAGLVLGIGRALAETAALMFTAGYATRPPSSLLDSGRSMSFHIYDMAMNVAGGNDRAYATAAVLVVMLLVINAIAFWLTRVAGGQEN